MSGVSIQINRAPVLTLWAAIVAERLGFDEAEALTLGKALAGYTAQSKGQLLGIYHPRESAEPTEPAGAPESDMAFVALMGRSLPAHLTPNGVRASARGQPTEPESVRRYLRGKFGDALPAAEQAMRRLAMSYPADRLDAEAYRLYERFRPAVEKGKRGWGAEGTLDLDRVLALKLKS